MKGLLIYTMLITALLFISCSKEIEEPTVIKDFDGNIYDTIRIGTQTWMVQNFKSTHFNDGTEINLIVDNAEWANSAKPAFCYIFNWSDYYGYDSLYKSYGVFYNWYAINSEKFSPQGWRVPVLNDWETLRNYLIENGYNADGATSGDKIGRSMAIQYDSYFSWFYSDMVGTVGYYLGGGWNSTKFSAFPFGYRRPNGIIQEVNATAIWWCKPAQVNGLNYCVSINYNASGLGIATSNKKAGYSVRLIKEN
jgi:uncharacterized protein (TIGR02145 family)